MKISRWSRPAFFIASLILIMALIKQFGIVERYLIADGSNDPAMVSGRKVFISNLIRPKRMDFIVYRQDSGGIKTGDERLMRIAGVAGDTVEIKSGVLYINHQNADTNRNVKREYIVPAGELKKISADFYQTHREEIVSFAGDSSDVPLESKQYEQNRLQGRQVLQEQADTQISARYHQPWNADQFGPVIVPADSFFVLGENRHHAKDSRYTGFVGKDKLVGVVFSGVK